MACSIELKEKEDLGKCGEIKGLVEIPNSSIQLGHCPPMPTPVLLPTLSVTSETLSRINPNVDS